MKKAIVFTKDYALFTDNPINREVMEDTKTHAALKASMATDGWWHSEPMVVLPMSRGKHTITKGHHRFTIAKELGIGVWYVIDEQQIPIHRREGPLSGGRPHWSQTDWVASHAKDSKNSNYKTLWEYHQRTGIPIGLCVRMLSFNIGLSQLYEEVRDGSFRIADTVIPEQVEWVVSHCFRSGVLCARKEGFAAAVWKLLRFKVVSFQELKKRLETGITVLRKYQGFKNYMVLVNEAFNHRQHPRRDLLTELRNAETDLQRRQMSEKSGKADRQKGWDTRRKRQAQLFSEGRDARI